MTISKDLFLSILSMDAYNRGYNPSIAGLSDAVDTGIGTARVKQASDSRADSAEVAASFYAISYTIGTGVDGIAPGTTVISYRGTDKPAKELALVDFAMSYGGSFAQKQIAFAQQFFSAVDASNGASPMLLTGHSLGGRLAGLQARLFGNEAIAA